ncbi:MAG: hypothetical protein A2297_00475 [Elusimicrobia bacterium RIFOXYB2_FULL_48_7]|nr:MAG: hypothetical protein A2297_00475 [Elusimicrobia bacterium RIFOXYB2_FULL_48_7]
MELKYIFSFLGVYTILVMPGIMLAYCLFRDRELKEIFLLGNTLGLALAIFTGYFACMAGLARINYFVYVLGAQYVVSISLFLSALKSKPSFKLPGASSFPLIFLCLVVFVSRLIPLFYTQFPRGWDPSFHCIIAQKLLITGILPDNWMPFEPSAMNYTMGSHILLALVSKFTGIPVHQAFKLFYPFLAVLAALGIYCLALYFTDNRKISVLSFVSYSFLANWGSVDYYNWGGLPNMFGMLFLLVILLLVLKQPAGTGRVKNILIGSILLSAVYLTHHLSAVVIISLFSFYALLGLIRSGKLDKTSSAFIFITLLSLVLSFIPLLPFISKVGTITSTTALKYFDEPMILPHTALKNVGMLLSALAITGIYLVFREKRMGEAGRFFLVYWAAELLAVYFCLDYVYRAFTMLIFKENFTAFTPSRFLTDMAYPLSIFSAVCLYKVLEKIKFKGSFALIVAAMVMYGSPAIKNQCGPDRFAPKDAAGYEWMGKNTPEGGVLLVWDYWAPYIAWRETLYTPLPSSENRANEYSLDKLKVENFDSARAWLNKYGRKGYLPLDASVKPDLNAVRLTAQLDNLCLYEVK